METEFDGDNDCDCETMAQTDGLDEDWYNVSLPENTRHTKRTKERSKQRYHKSGSIEKNKHGPRRLSGHNSPSPGRHSNTVRGSVSDGMPHVNVDVNAPDVDTGGFLEQLPNALSAKKRKDSLKNFTTSRTYERDLKLSSSDLVSMDTPAVQVQPASLDASGPFMCLNPKLVPQAACDKKQSDSTVQKPVTPPECPRDRIMFYKTFSMLINLGNVARKEKENKMGPYTRQLSCEQEVWQNEVNDVIWLELQAWYSGRTLKHQDEHLCAEREKVPVVLDEVMNFKVPLADLTSRWPDAVTGEDSSELGDGITVVCKGSSDNVIEVSSEGESNGGEVVYGVGRRSSLLPSSASGKGLETCLEGCIWECAQSLAERTVIQKEALVLVSTLLDKLDTVEHLYPTTKALGKEYPLYDTPEFQQRVDTLYLWMNIVKDLGHKLQLMAKVLHVDTIEGLQWPWLESTVCETKNNTTVGDSDSESDMSVTHMTSDSGKNVRFNLSDASLDETAAAISDLQHQTSVSSNYRASVEDICLAHIYRHFVDRTLKKTGMRKLLLRLIRITSGTLQRAKEALQKPKTTPSYADVVQEVSVVLSSSFKIYL